LKKVFKMRQKGFAPILILLILIGLGFVGYFAYKNYSAPKSIVFPNPPTNSPTATPIITVSTAGRKTYTNNQLGYEITYPGSNTTIQSDVQSTTITYSVPTKGGINDFPFPDRFRVEIRKLDNPKNISLKVLGNENFATDSKVPYDLGWKDVVFNNVPAIVSTHMLPGDGGTQTVYILQENSSVIAVWKEVVDTTYENIADQILSTFKSTN
jgi:hypothetical protein